MTNFVTTWLTIHTGQQPTQTVINTLLINPKDDNPDATFTFLLPTPPDLTEPEQQGRWREAAWGSRWDCQTNNAVVHDNDILLTLETPWEAPIPFFVALSERFPHITIEADYEEDMQNFSGSFSIQNGQIEHDENSSPEPG